MLPQTGGAVTASQVITAHLDCVTTIPLVTDLRQRIERDNLLRELWEQLLGYFDRWEQLVEAAVLRRWQSSREQEFLLPPSVSIEKSRKDLSSQLQKKQIFNVETIRDQYGARFSPRSRLDEGLLTRLRSSTLVQRTELRDLFEQGFDSFHYLYPVLLTNPDTACTILPLKPELYDLLIMDEASQVYMADAIPLLYRANKVVISGDQRQMPPSDYFMQGVADGFADEEEESETDEDDGSMPLANKDRLVPAEGEYCLLDAAVFAVQADRNANRYLRIHYRSDFAELINFSNHAFYENRLFAPPGNQEPLPCCPTPIVLKQVGGAFNKGENKMEALAVLEVLKATLKLENPPSIGIIAFNVKQRDLIDEVLFEEGKNDDNFRQLLENAKQQSGPEGDDQSLFVRSVEHVQGDERELIIFSTTYDAGTRSFGPLSILEKGQRRLNVAVTRAKKGVILLSSLDIDRISNENEKGLRERYYLWKYLRYAQAINNQNMEEAEAILVSLSGHAITSTRQAAESPFEDEVADFLASHYHVDYQIGVGGFRIDLGIKVQKEDTRYLVGIECDGRRWHSSWSARMNDVWRQKVLEAKGWRIERVWSTDWYNDGENTRQDLLSRIRRIQDLGR
jgi:very-short-patch-repair endonuclease